MYSEKRHIEKGLPVKPITHTTIALLFALLTAFFPFATLAHESAPARGNDEARNHLIEVAMPATYLVKLSGRIFDTKTGDERSQGFQRMGLGTGFGVTQSGLVLTKMHVVNPNYSFVSSRLVGTNTFAYEDGTSIEVQIEIIASDGQEWKATIVGGSPSDDNDLALLQIMNPGAKTFPTIELARDPSRYDSVVTIGNPFGIEFTVGEGVVSNPKATIPKRHLGRVIKKQMVQTNALVLPGSSGGPIIRLRNHEVVGMSDSTYTPSSGSFVNLGFGTPASVLAKFLKDELLRMPSR